MNENTNTAGVATATETVTNHNPAPVATETVAKVKGAVGRNPHKPKMYRANEDGSIMLVNGVAQRFGKGKPKANVRAVWAVPSKKGSAQMTYTIVPRPVKVVKAVVETVAV